MTIKASEKDIPKSSAEETANLTLVNAVFKQYFAKEIGKVKESDFQMLTGKEKEAFIKDLHKIQALITQGYNSTMDFISYSLQVVK